MPCTLQALFNASGTRLGGWCFIFLPFPSFRSCFRSIPSGAWKTSRGVRLVECPRRVRQEDHRSCRSGSCIVVGLMLTCRLDRTKASWICARFLSSSGTRNPTTRTICGSLLAINARRATPSHGLPRCTDARRSTSPAATLLPRHNNLACYPLWDTNLAVPCPRPNSVR